MDVSASEAATGPVKWLSLHAPMHRSHSINQYKPARQPLKPAIRSRRCDDVIKPIHPVFLPAGILFLLILFLQRVAMHSTDYAVARCPSVRLSHAGIVTKRLNVSSKIFTFG